MTEKPAKKGRKPGRKPSAKGTSRPSPSAGATKRKAKAAPSSATILTPKQIEQRKLAAGPARHILAYGGSRSGKTFGFVRCMIVRALLAPNSRHGIFRLHNIDVRQSVMMDTFPAVMRLCFPNVRPELNRSDQFAAFPNGSEVWFGGLDDKERTDKILGKEFATIYVNEASQVPYSSVMTLRTRLAQMVTKTNGETLALKAYYDLNPVGRKHWTYAEFHTGRNPVDGRPLPDGQRAVIQMNPKDNPHLPPEYLQELEALPTKERARYLEGIYQSDLPNALWPMEVIDAARVHEAPPLRRIVVGVDPSGSDGVGGDSQGIVVVGIGEDGHGYVLEDASIKASPAGWGHRVIETYHRWQADIIVAEANFGGAMVEATIRAYDKRAKVKLVRASRGKHVRAEPIAALYETTPGKPATVHHVGIFPELEDQMGQFTSDGFQGAGSPDRADALVWALTELMGGKSPAIGVLARRRAA